MYKWVDERGAVTYSNVPPPPATQAKNFEAVTDRVSVYTPDPLINRAMSDEARRDAKIDSLERQLEAERRSRASASQSAASARSARQAAAYERCVSERRVDCESILSGTPGDASYSSNSYYGPQYIVGPRVPYLPQVPFYVEDKPPPRVGVSTAPRVGISTAPKVGIDDRPPVGGDTRAPVGAQPRHRAVGDFR